MTKLVHLDFKSESFPFKAIHTSYPSLIETFLQEYFDAFIYPKKNESLSLKDHRFDYIFECYYSLVHHMYGTKSYLEKFSSVVNSFLDMEVLKPIFCATRLIEIHITGLYQYLLMNVDTNYDIVLQGFYPKLNIIKGADMLNIK